MTREMRGIALGGIPFSAFVVVAGLLLGVGLPTTVMEVVIILITGQLLSLIAWILFVRRIIEADGALTQEGRFATGFIAGIAPFLFLWLFPAMVDAGAGLDTDNIPSKVLAVGITGVLVGLIVAITDAGSRDKPTAVFARALGVPALLLGTITGLTTKSHLRQAEHAANDRELQAVPAQTVDSLEKVPVADSRRKISFNALRPSLVRTAWAADVPTSQTASAGAKVVAPVFLVVLAEFSNAERREADRKYHELRDATLRTERYWPKSIEMYRNPADSAFLIAYSRHSDEDEASRVYRLLRINDPKLTPKLVILRN